MSSELALVSESVPEKAVRNHPRPLKGEPAVALSLAAGATITQAADSGGVNEKTVRRRLATPAYRAEVRRLRSEKLERVVGHLTEATAVAVSTLVDLLNATSEHVRLGAVKTVLEYAISLSENVETRERIEALEYLVLRQHQAIRDGGTRVPHGS
jgi:hypothetical protein